MFCWGKGMRELLAEGLQSTKMNPSQLEKKDSLCLTTDLPDLVQYLVQHWWNTVLNWKLYSSLSWESTDKILSLISWTCFWFNIFIKLFAFSKHLLQSSYDILFLYNVSNLRKHCQKNNCSSEWSEKGDCTLSSMFFMLIHMNMFVFS